MLPKLFIGSSKEAQDAGLLDGLQVALDAALNSPNPCIELVPWPISPWQNLNVAMQSLIDNLVDYSYGIFILSADDELLHRGQNYYAARDNVIFEFGLFLAYLGHERTFLIGPSGSSSTISVSSIKTSAPYATPPSSLPLKILSDLGSAYRKGSYSVSNAGVSPTIDFHINDVVATIKSLEAKITTSSIGNASAELDQRLLTAKAEISKNGKTNSYYSGQFFSRFRDIATLKAKITSKSVQSTVKDLLLHLERLPDLCDVGQLASEQHYSNDISEVWVFSETPLEFRAGKPDAASSALRKTIIENLINGVTYTYFVGPKFNVSDINFLVDKNHVYRDKILKSMHIIKVPSQFFSTFFTLHFEQGNGKNPKAIYMSSVMSGSKDILIQVSDNEHINRIYERICVLKGELESEDSPKITRYTVNH